MLVWKFAVCTDVFVTADLWVGYLAGVKLVVVALAAAAAPVAVSSVHPLCLSCSGDNGVPCDLFCHNADSHAHWEDGSQTAAPCRRNNPAHGMRNKTYLST